MKEFLNLKNSEITKLITNGFVKLPSIKTILNTNEFTNKIVKEMGDTTFSTSSKTHKEILEIFGINKYLATTLFKIAKEKFNYKGSINNQYHVVRMVRPGDIKEQYRAHFDSHIFTLVIPINIPYSKNKERGELLFYPNARKYPGTEIENIIGKVLFKKYANKASMNKLIKNNKAILENFDDLSPLIFNGMTTLHTNRFVHEEITGNRLTILAHFFDPSPSFGIGSLLRKIRKR